MATETGEASKPRKFSASEGLIIEKGPGTQLKHIPNVAFKLSKRKPDDEKTAKAHNLKKNIGQFSGHVSAENEKQKQSSQPGKKRKHSSDVEDYEVSKAKEDTSKALKRTSRKGGKAASKTSKTPLVKDQVKGVSSKKAKIEPSNEEMRAGVTDILKKEVGNFIKTSEIIEKLGTHFGLDLMHRKVEVMAIIRNVILGESASPSKSKQQDTNGKATSKTSKTLEDQGKGISSKKVNVEPSKEEMIPVVVDILKVVPLGVGLSDIVEKLGTHFGLDLMHRKEEVKAIVIHVLLHNRSNSYNDGEVGETGDDGDDDQT